MAGSTSGQFSNITLRNVQLYSSTQSPGVVLGSPLLPMRSVTFQDVVVHPECGAASRNKAGGFGEAFPRLPRTVPRDGFVTVFYVLLVVLSLIVPFLVAGVVAAARPRWAAVSMRARAKTCACVVSHIRKRAPVW